MIVILVKKLVIVKFMVMILIWKFIFLVWVKISKVSKFKEIIVILDNMEGIFCGRLNRFWFVVFFFMIMLCYLIEIYVYFVKIIVLYIRIFCFVFM